MARFGKFMFDQNRNCAFMGRSFAPNLEALSRLVSLVSGEDKVLQKRGVTYLNAQSVFLIFNDFSFEWFHIDARALAASQPPFRPV